MKDSRQGITVVLCCHNSANRLPETLNCLASQKFYRSIQWEVIVVDNASTDGTGEVAKTIWDQSGNQTEFRVVSELKPGQKYARQKGIEESAFDIILFCDDDNHLHPEYVSRSASLMMEKKEVFVAGGFPRPKFSFSPGEWIKDFYGALAIGVSRPDGFVDWVFGAGMVVRKELFVELDGKGIEFLLPGRSKSAPTSGDDVEICLLARFLTRKIYYTCGLVLDHAISANRLTKSSFMKSAHKNFHATAYLFILEKIVARQGGSPTRMYCNHTLGRLGSIFRFLPRCVVGAHRFYSLVTVYGNFLYVFWLLLHIRGFFLTYRAIARNLKLQ